MLLHLSGSTARRGVFAACAAVALLISAAFTCPALGIDQSTAATLSAASWLVGALAIAAVLEDVLYEDVLPLARGHMRKILLLS